MEVKINEKKVELLSEILSDGLGLIYDSHEFKLDNPYYRDNGQRKRVTLEELNIEIGKQEVKYLIKIETLSNTNEVLTTNKLWLGSSKLEEFIKVTELNSKHLSSIVINKIVNDMKIASKVLNDNGELVEPEPYLPPRDIEVKPKL